MTKVDGYRYWGFLSYSSKDTSVAMRLHRALESYRVPADLVGKPTREGDAVPRSLFPIFRDRDELSLAADLGSSVKDALRASRYLIVICSPHAAQSRWVSEEVRFFRSLGREDRILAVIVSGAPNASDHSWRMKDECFPVALRFRTGPDGSLTEERTEPMAGDLRRGGDGWTICVLKAVAGMTGLPFDAFLKRQEVRQRRERLLCCAGAVLGLALLGMLIDQWDRSTKEPYYAQLTERFGVPSGVIPLKKEACTTRAQTYKVASSRRKVRRIVCVNGTDSPVPVLDQAGLEPVAIREITYRDDGQLDRIQFRSPNGLRLATTDYIIEKNDTPVVIYMKIAREDALTPPNANPRTPGSRNGGTETQSAIVYHKIEYRADGLPARRFYLDGNRKPLANSEGHFGEAYHHDQDGLVIQIRILGKDGQPISDPKEIAIRLLKRDEPSRSVTREILQNNEGKAVLGPKGYAEIKYHYDKYGNLEKLGYFDVDGKTTAATEGYATVSYLYDERGTLKKVEQFDVSGNRTAEVNYAHDEHGALKKEEYVGVDGKRTAEVTYAHDQLGRLEKQEWLDVEGKLVNGPGGYAKVTYSYDPNNKVTLHYFDVNGSEFIPQAFETPRPPDPPSHPENFPVSFTSEPVGAQLVWADMNQALGVLPIRDYIIPAGEHTFVAYYKDWEPLRKQLTIGPTRPEDVVFRWPHGEVDFVSDPPGARVVRDGEQLGVTPFHFVLQAGNQKMQAQLPGLEDVPIRFDLSHGDKGKVPITFRYGTVSIETAPAEVDVYMDGHKVGVAPLKFNLRPGPIRLNFRKPGYESADYSGSLPAGKILNVRITMHN